MVELQLGIVRVYRKAGICFKQKGSTEHFFRLDDIDQLLEAMEITACVTDVIIDDNRRRHITILLSERGNWSLESAATDSTKHIGTYRGRLFKRTIKRSKSVMNMFVSNTESKDWENGKAKNVKQVNISVCIIQKLEHSFYKKFVPLLISGIV